VYNRLEWWIADYSLIERAWLRDVLDDAEVELVFAEFGVCGADLVGLLLRADGGDDAVAVLEEDVEDVGGDEAGATSQEDSRHIGRCGVEAVSAL